MPIIRRNNCVHVTLGTCYSVWMTVWYAGWPPCIPDSHPHRITSTKCRMNAVVSPDDGHIVARNMWRLINILRMNILRINCAPSWLYLQDNTGMHGQQNIKHYNMSLITIIRSIQLILITYLLLLFINIVYIFQYSYVYVMLLT